MEPLCERFSTTTFDANGQLAGFSLHYEDNFNFGYDVVDAIAKEEPHKRAVQWCDEQGAEKMLTFCEISQLSTKAAGVLKALGIGKGDRVLVMLKRHWEYWFMAPALHKLGAVIVPATHMLRVHDITYRIGAADIKAIVCAESKDLCGLSANRRADGVTAGGDGAHPDQGDGSHADVLHLWYDGQSEDGHSQLHLSAGAYRDREILAVRPERRTAPDCGRHRLGEMLVGQDLRSVALRQRGHGL